MADELPASEPSNLMNNLNRPMAGKGVKTMVPHGTYRNYQIERAKSPAEIRRADQQAAQLASALSSLFRGLTRPVRAVRRPSPAAGRRLPRPA